MRPICASCEIEYRPEKNGIRVCEHASFGPYKIWQADLWKCPKCGHLLIHGFGWNAESEHFMDGFKELLKEVDFNCYEKVKSEVLNV